mgnify:CR=1 FL=1
MKFILPILIFLSLLLSKETITEVTETYPDGLPKEVTVYALVKDLSENNPFIPLQKYSYDKDGNLTKYREYWENGKQSKELQINRGRIVERNWDINGRPKKMNQYSQDEYEIPKVISSNHENEQTMDEILKLIDQISIEIENSNNKISNNYKLIVKESETISYNNQKVVDLENSFKVFQKSIDSLQDNLKGYLKDEISSMDNDFYSLINLLDNLEKRIIELELDIASLNEKLNSNDNKIDYKNFKRNSNKKIEDLKQEIRTLKNEIKQVKKMIDDNAD